MTIYIDPAYQAYYQNKLFDAGDALLNRDDTLSPFIRLKNVRQEQILTADFLHEHSKEVPPCDYYSLGLLDHLESVAQRREVCLKAFVLFEPPVVAPGLYRRLPRLTQLFERVYVHNTEGDGYGLKGVDRTKLHKLYWPQPRADVLEELWAVQKRQRRIVVINGNHKPKSYEGELYSQRIEVMVKLAALDCVDLYGRGWNNWRSRESMWLPYWSNRRTLLSIYQGPCDSKYEVLSRYYFCLCFENMQMKGYVTEKLFDCFYAGTIPIYLGASDISDLIPKGAYIDFRQFKSVLDLKEYLMGLSEDEIQRYKEVARDFLKSEAGRRYYDAMQRIVETGSGITHQLTY